MEVAPVPRLIRMFLATLLLAALAACGSDSGGTAAPASSATAPEQQGFPVSVVGKFGTTTVPARPVRVVAMDWTDADFALSLGVRPVGLARVPTVGSGLQPWTAAALGDRPADQPVLFDASHGDRLEQVAALKPDLILATKDYNLEHSYAQLSQLAPVVGYVEGPNSDSWQQDFENVATALGLAAQGKAVSGQTDAWIAQEKAGHPELQGKTFSYIVAPTPGGVYVVNSPRDASAQVLSQLGLVLKPEVQTLATSAIPGRAQLSTENLSVLDAQVILATGTSGALDEFARSPVAGQLTGMRNGGFVPLDYPTAGALAFPSPLSLRWGVTRVLPALSAAARRG
jgi:iron complex transport system substrate-binding protein